MIPDDLPISPFLEEICSTLKNSESRFLILSAETAAGKSTAVPPALLNAFPKKILMLEPRRLAVLSIAERISSMLEEETGGICGYRMHLENCVSEKTRLEIITEAILTRRLQNDPALEDVSVVVLDEFHERSVHTDLALAFLKEAMPLRDDLYVVVMSATIETKRLSEYLGTAEKPAPVIKVPGRKFPVKVEYAGNVSPSKAVLDEVKKCSPGQTILVFLPGIYEINMVKEELLESGMPDENCRLLILHSSIDFKEQKKVLEPLSENEVRVVLSSAIAETSLTVPGVRTVIDSGFARLSRMNITLGMEHLVTERESLFSAEQRSGRAGRLAEGKCIRLWNKNDVLNLETPPEILRSDITSLVLECFAWGVKDFSALNWLTPPNMAAWNEAVKLLKELDCIDEKNTITETGRASLKLGLHPRLCKVALCGFSEAVLNYSNYGRSSVQVQRRFLQDLENRLKKIPESVKIPVKEKSLAVLNGFPDRIARHAGKGLYKFPSGRLAHIQKKEAERISVFPEWIVAPEVDSGDIEGCIYSYEVLDENLAGEWLKNRLKTEVLVDFENDRLCKKEILCYGKLIFSEKKLNVSSEDYGAAVCVKIKREGLDFLPFNAEAESLLMRAAFYSEQKGMENKAEKTVLSENAQEWLLPFLSGQNSVSEKMVFDALYWYLGGAEIDREVPVQIVLSNGKKRKLTYEKLSSPEDKTKLIIRPVLEIIIQQIFGCFETPEVMGVPVLLRLLSPARRPLQITDDLANFWSNTWPEICKEMKGRYPKHKWDYKISCDE